MNDLLNKKYNLELEVLTPLHVGAGQEKDWMKGADYIEDGNKIYILNHKKIAKEISANELSNFLVEKNDEGLKNKISRSLEEVSYKVFEKTASTDNDIKTFIKNGLTNKPIVPGSSIKGAIRSILLNYFIDNPNNIDRRDKRFEEKVFGSPNNGDEFMRFIKIADAQFDKTELVNTKIFNLYKDDNNFNGGWKKSGKQTNANFDATGFNTIYEVIKPSETGELSIALSDKAFDNFYKTSKPEKKNEILHSEPSKKLFAIINEHTKKYINKQIAFFEKYANNETDKIIDSLNAVLSQIQKNNTSCVLKMSAGSGFHSITGDWQFDDFSIDQVIDKTNRKGDVIGHISKFKGDISAKSRKIAIDGDAFYLMGFVKLTILSEELKAQRESEREAKIEAERKIKAEELAKEKAEQERIKAEQRAKEEAIRRDEEERIANEKAEQEEKERLQKEREDKLKQAQEANAAKKEELKSTGLLTLANIDEFTKGKNIIKDYKKLKKSIDLSQFEYIKDFIKRSINKDNKKWKSVKRDNWKDVKSWVGQETAQQWYNELSNK